MLDKKITIDNIRNFLKSDLWIETETFMCYTLEKDTKLINIPKAEVKTVLQMVSILSPIAQRYKCTITELRLKIKGTG